MIKGVACPEEVKAKLRVAPHYKGREHPQYTRIDTPCPECGKVTAKIPWAVKHGRTFCSHKCANKFHRERMRTGRYVGCLVCGKLAWKKPFELQHRPNTLCSMECRSIYYSQNFSGENSPQWRGGGGRLLYSEMFRKLRRELIERKGRCQVCGRKGKLEVHHVVPVRLRLENPHVITNLTVLCRSCHRLVENGKKEVQLWLV